MGPPLEPSPLWPHVRLADTDRLESFSDGVFAITITLSVFEIVRPEHEPGHLLEKLLAQWPNYVAFLALFFYIGVIWLNHRAVFARVHYCDRSLHLANLFSLLASALKLVWLGDIDQRDRLRRGAAWNFHGFHDSADEPYRTEP